MRNARPVIQIQEPGVNLGALAELLNVLAQYSGWSRYSSWACDFTRLGMSTFTAEVAHA